MQLVHLSKESTADWKVDKDDTVVLQMSGYGYARRGAPLWLLRELEARRNDIKTLGIYFHELYAFGPPWSSSFWLSPVQRHIASRLAELSDFWMTNREGSAQWLRRYAGDKPHAVLPVFSNVGESIKLPAIGLPRIVVFGSAGLRQASYQAAGDELFSWAKSASLEIHDIGPPIADTQLDEILCANGVIQHGRLDEREVGSLMEGAQFGLLAYPAEYVAKSSVFAAYCAHGICPVVISKNYVQADGLVADNHYLTEVPDAKAMLSAPNIGLAAREWYRPHNLESHATMLLNYIGAKTMAGRC
ncbi:MAG: hypothetical protein HY938_08955 [Nitrosomonadales bacterium]|nr:hypothetical protein [Nitrosomonadales bacterium]